jgi:DNA processing protein
LAAGIDAAAHRAAVDEAGSTIAVLGNGIDIAYPRRNAPLYDRIRTRGLILSEFPLGTPPLSTHFPRRNRIISGLARGCLVIEAAMASGSLITARLAVEMGRDVFAVPGSIHSPLSRGCHYLIKQGAKLVETADDVLEELGMASGGPDKTQAPNARLPAGNAGKLLNAFGHASCDIDTLVAISGIEVDELLALLVELELEGWVSRLTDGSYQRVK